MNYLCYHISKTQSIILLFGCQLVVWIFTLICTSIHTCNAAVHLSPISWSNSVHECECHANGKLHYIYQWGTHTCNVYNVGLYRDVARLLSVKQNVPFKWPDFSCSVVMSVLVHICLSVSLSVC